MWGGWGWKPNRPNRRDVVNHAVGAPTNRHIERLNDASLADYKGALVVQNSAGAKNPVQRAAALQKAKQKAGIGD